LGLQKFIHKLKFSMAKYKNCNYDQMIMVPVCLKDQLLPGTLEYTIHTLIEERVDMSIFDDNYNNDDTGCPAYDPKIMFKIILFGYARGLTTSRKLEKACRENIIFMALTCGQAPDHSTIATFIPAVKAQIMPMFQDILLFCDELGLLGGTTFSADGLKLPSNASKDKSGTIEQLDQKKQRLEKRLAELMDEHIENDAKVQKAKQLEKRIETLNEFLHDNEPKINSRGKEIKSNVTDNDSSLMMTSHGVIQGYNAQAIVDSKHQIVMFPDAGTSGQDNEHLALLIEGAKDNLVAIGKDDECLKQVNMLADANYLSPTNVEKLQDEQINGYIPDTDFRKRDPRLIQGDPKFSLADFYYNEDDDVYTCPAGETLTRQPDSTRNGKKYYRHYAAEETKCSSCSVRHRCLAKKTSKRRYLSVYYDKKIAAYAHDMMSKLDTEEGRKIYDQRLGMVEPVFANIRVQKRMDRFWRRGKDKVNIEWILYCMVHNIEKCIQYCRKPALSPAI